MSYGGKIYEPDLRRENNGHLSLNIASSAHSLRLWIAIEMQLYLNRYYDGTMDCAILLSMVYGFVTDYFIG